MTENNFIKFYTYDLSDPPRYHNEKINYDYFDWLFSMLAGTDLTFMYRCNLAGRAYYHSNYMAQFDHSCVEHKNLEADMWHKVAYALEGCDPFAEAVRAAKKHKVHIWAWVKLISDYLRILYQQVFLYILGAIRRGMKIGVVGHSA